VHVLALHVLGQGIHVRCADPTARAMLAMAYSSMRGEPGTADLEYTVRRYPSSARLQLARRGAAPFEVPDDGTLLARFDADVAIELQRRRPDLYFVHSAVLVRGGGAVLLVARSGVGKSTLCWALAHHGFRYASDELGPVDMARLEVLPYPRTLMVKRDPPASYPMPAGVRTSRGLHVPPEAMPCGLVTTAAPVAGIFFLRRASRCEPSHRRLTPAEGAARLYANALNPLAHSADGLDGAIRLATARPCFEVVTADLALTCGLVAAALEEARR
jgi:hypothetical protein